MAKLEELDRQQQQPNDIKKRKKKIEGSTKLFVFVDYLFLFIFFGFLIVILLKMVGVWCPRPKPDTFWLFGIRSLLQFHTSLSFLGFLLFGGSDLDSIDVMCNFSGRNLGPFWGFIGLEFVKYPCDNLEVFVLHIYVIYNWKNSHFGNVTLGHFFLVTICFYYIADV